MKFPEHKPRRQLDAYKVDQYMESDTDYMVNNRFLAVALLDAFAEGKLFVTDPDNANCPTCGEDGGTTCGDPHCGY